jgi:hypothetical protein
MNMPVFQEILVVPISVIRMIRNVLSVLMRIIMAAVQNPTAVIQIHVILRQISVLQVFPQVRKHVRIQVTVVMVLIYVFQENAVEGIRKFALLHHNAVILQKCVTIQPAVFLMVEDAALTVTVV